MILTRICAKEYCRCLLNGQEPQLACQFSGMPPTESEFFRLKSPYRTDMKVVELNVEVLGTDAKILVPRIVRIVFGGTPVEVGLKTANCTFVEIELVQLIPARQVPVAIAIQHQIITQFRRIGARALSGNNCGCVCCPCPYSCSGCACRYIASIPP